MEQDDLSGAKEIAIFMSWLNPDGTPDTRRVYYEAETKRWPIFKMHNGQGSSRLRSSKASLLRHREALVKRAEQEAWATVSA